ncbi:MAG: peptidase M10 [Ferruginibacter sp.]
MGEVELQHETSMLIIHADLVFYGDAATDALSFQVAKNISDQWNMINGKLLIKGREYKVLFDINGKYNAALTANDVYENTDLRINYFRIEEYVTGNISFVDDINSNTGYFKLDNLLNESTTAAHEFGHTIGLRHPLNLDIREERIPGIMYPRGTLVKPEFQYDPAALPATVGGTLNPIHRKVLQQDIALLNLHKLNFHNGMAIIGAFTSVWHDKHLPV